MLGGVDGSDREDGGGGGEEGEEALGGGCRGRTTWIIFLAKFLSLGLDCCGLRIGEEEDLSYEDFPERYLEWKEFAKHHALDCFMCSRALVFLSFG